MSPTAFTTIAVLAIVLLSLGALFVLLQLGRRISLGSQHAGPIEAPLATIPGVQPAPWELVNTEYMVTNDSHQTTVFLIQLAQHVGIPPSEIPPGPWPWPVTDQLLTRMERMAGVDELTTRVVSRAGITVGHEPADNNRPS